jgi:hypothetical protein
MRTEAVPRVELLRRIGLVDIKARAISMERTGPLRSADKRYLLDAIFRGTWDDYQR